MKTFEEYVLDWWNEYLDDAEDSTLKALMENLIGEEETIDDYIPEDAESPREWLRDNMTADEVYNKYFGLENDGLCPDNMPDRAEFNYQMLKENVSWWNGGQTTLPSFTEEFLSDMVNHIEDYDTPLEFFKDLAYGSCQSGMIGMLIYNSDCKKIYIEHIDDMEEYMEQIYDEVGYMKNEKRLPHYVLVCWTCYEELAYRIARELYPETF